MRNSGTLAIAISLAAAVSACGSPENETAPAADQTVAAVAPAAAADGRPASFGQCAACHAVEPGKHGIGPSLAGVHGAKAGAAQGYAFSGAMKSAGLTWDDATLNRYIEAPMKAVPGTKMSYAGMRDPAKRAEIIAYLKTLK